MKEEVMKTYPKECVNNNCKNVFYVPKEHLHLLLQCKQCTEKSRKNNYV